MQRSLSVLLICASFAFAAEYELGPDSKVQPGVPKGTVTKHSWTSAGTIFPGTVRDYWVYVPAQYDASKPAAVMVFQDGVKWASNVGNGWLTPIVFDNLIAKGDMPVTIGIFVNPGMLPARSPGLKPRLNRNYEYASTSGDYARFIVEEILPEVARDYNLTDDPNLRGIGGSSGGGQASFTAAWNRPDVFRRVLSFIGSYVNIRGADIYQSRVRKMEPKPLRVFLQDGSNDLDLFSGSFWLANQSLRSALHWAGYDYKWVAGEEGHNKVHGLPILPDALRWLWRDWETPIEPSREKTFKRPPSILDFLEPEHDWELVSEGHTFLEGPAVAPNGDVYFSDVRESKIFRVDAKTSEVSLFKDNTGWTNGLMFGPDGRIYTCRRKTEQIVAIHVETMEEEVIAEGAQPNDIVINAKGDLYFSSPWTKRVWFVPKGGEARIVFEDPNSGFLNGLMLSPDQSMLMVNDSRKKFVWSFQIEPDGSLAYGEEFFRLETWDKNSQSRADGMTIADDGHLFVATDLGVQVCNDKGPVVGIIRKPTKEFVSNVVFAGPELKTLYATASTKLFRRKLQASGVRQWEPFQPPRPGL